MSGKHDFLAEFGINLGKYLEWHISNHNLFLIIILIWFYFAFIVCLMFYISIAILYY